MEGFISWLSPVLITLLLALPLLWKLIGTRNKVNTPPGPKPWPIIGNLNLVGAIPHQSLHNLSKKYGGIMQLKFGSSPIIVASTPEIAKEFLKTHDNLFISRPVTAAGQLTGYNSSNITWAPHGPYWQQGRRIYANELLSTRQIDSYEYMRVEQKKIFISQLYDLVGQPIDLRKQLVTYTLTNISRMALGDNYFTENKSDNPSGTTLAEFQGLLDEWFYLNGVFNMGDWIPWLDFLDLQGYVEKMKDFARRVDKFNSHVVDVHTTRRESAGKNFVPKDIIDVLLQFSNDPTNEVKLTSDNIKALMQEVLAGGTDTSATTVEWAMAELLKHPHLFEKATEELDRVIGRERWVEEKDSTQLPFIEAIVKEATRLHPAATFLAPHMCIADCTVAGYHIPKGTNVFVNVWSLGRDPRHWENPEEFRPERFIGKNIDERGQHFELLPFGSGRRMCPGYRLGMRLIRSTLANLLHGFTWKLPDNVKPEGIDMEEEYGLTTHRKTSITAIMEPRLPAHMYQLGRSEKPNM